MRQLPHDRRRTVLQKGNKIIQAKVGMAVSPGRNLALREFVDEKERVSGCEREKRLTLSSEHVDEFLWTRFPGTLLHPKTIRLDFPGL